MNPNCNVPRSLTKRAQGRRKFGLKNFKRRYFCLTNHSLMYAKGKGKALNSSSHQIQWLSNMPDMSGTILKCPAESSRTAGHFVRQLSVQRKCSAEKTKVVGRFQMVLFVWQSISQLLQIKTLNVYDMGENVFTSFVINFCIKSAFPPSGPSV